MEESGFVSIEEVANIFEITATEFCDTKDTEIARDYMISASVLRENEKLTQALHNCYMLACRRSRGPGTPENADWKHLRRFCEEAGFKPSITRNNSL